MLRDLVREIYHAVRSVPDRLRHRARHNAAISRLRRVGAADQVLILCYGNICRSPYAAGRLRQLCTGRAAPRIDSAGFFGPGRPANDMAIRIALSRGVDLSHHTSKLVSKGLASGVGLVLVMTQGQADELRARMGGCLPPVEVLGDLDPAPITQRSIPDPYGHSDQVFELVFDRIDRCLRVVVETWTL